MGVEHFAGRYDTLKPVLPILGGLTGIVSIGEQLSGGWDWWIKFFGDIGFTKRSVLEIYHPNVAAIRLLPNWHKVYEADATTLDPGDVEPHDVVIWWHGPEHVRHDLVLPTVDRLVAAFSPKVIILGMPWGVHCNTERDFENPHSYHISTWFPKDWLGHGYSVATSGAPNTPGGHITAWRAIGERACQA